MLRPTSRFALPSANSILFYSLSFLATTISANALPQITQAATSIVLEPLGGLGEGTTISGVPGGLGDPTGGLGGPTATGMAESAANPFGFPAPPQPPNYIDPETRAPLVIGVNALFVGLSFICVILRYWSRLKIVGTTFLEDWLAALAWVLSFLVSFFVCWVVRVGLGRHWWDVPPEWVFGDNVPAGYVMTVLYQPSIMAVKASILIFFMRLDSNSRVGFRRACQSALCLLLIQGTIQTMLVTFPCKPLAAAWNFKLSLPPELGGVGAKCLPMATVHIVGAAGNVVIDFIILALPVKMVYEVKLPFRQKCQVGVVFGLGGFACVASIVRLYYVDAANHTMDWPWVGAFSALWSAVEINVCIICCCLPAIKPLLSRKWPRIFGNGSAPIGGNPHNMQADLRTIGGSGGSAPARNSARDSYALTYVEHTKGSSGRSHGSRSSGKSMGAFTGSGSDTFNRGDSQVNMGLSDDEYHENESEGDTRTGARNGYLRDNAGASEERILSNVEELEDLRLKNNNKSESIPSGGGLRH